MKRSLAIFYARVWIFFAASFLLSTAGGLHAQAPREITNSIGMKLVLIPNGTFQMGSPRNEEWRSEQEDQHEVTLSKDYYLGMYEVTQSQYQKVMGENPSRCQGAVIQGDSGHHPVEMVTWQQAVDFCERLSQLPEEIQEGRVYRLPTEAEWEYACRAGSKDAFYFGKSLASLSDYAWCTDNSEGKTHPVGEKKPNSWGLYDMHGNVLEWCSDWFSEHLLEAVEDPQGAEAGAGRVARGGAWNGVTMSCRSAYREGIKPSIKYASLGFRVAVSAPEVPESAPPPKSEEPRLWTSRDGRFKVEAVLVSASEDSIQLKRTDNSKTVSVPIEKISDEDQAYVQEYAAASKDQPSKP